MNNRIYKVVSVILVLSLLGAPVVLATDSKSGELEPVTEIGPDQVAY